MSTDRRGLPKRILAALLLAIAAGGDVHAMEVRMAEATKLESGYSFPETLQRLRAALEAKDITIFATIDQREAARSVGLDMPPTTLLIYGNPKSGTPLMVAAPDFGIELPLKVLVREGASGKVFVVYNPTRALDGKHGLQPGQAERLAGAEPLIAAAVGAEKRN